MLSITTNTTSTMMERWLVGDKVEGSIDPPKLFKFYKPLLPKLGMPRGKP